MNILFIVNVPELQFRVFPAALSLVKVWASPKTESRCCMDVVKETASGVNLNLNQIFLGGLSMMGHYVLFIKYIVKLLYADCPDMKNILR